MLLALSHTHLDAFLPIVHNKTTEKGLEQEDSGNTSIVLKTYYFRFGQLQNTSFSRCGGVWTGDIQHPEAVLILLVGTIGEKAQKGVNR